MLRLMHQQCWLWGFDIRSVEGNLLLEFGFERTRPMVETTGSSRYALRLDGWNLDLWGFGAVCRCGDMRLYINRYDVEPMLIVDPKWPQASTASPPEQASLAAVEPGTDPYAGLCERAARFFLWIAGYEEWVLQRRGLGYRRESLRAWTHSAYLPDKMPELWQEAAAEMMLRRNYT
jgi:hypothetical protein